MKDKQNKNIKLIAQKIVEAEKELRLGKNVQSNQQKIEELIFTLPFEDILSIDEYIQEQKLLTK